MNYTTAPAMERICFYTNEATAKRIKRRPARNGRTADEEVIFLLQGEHPEPDLALANTYWEWELDVPAELAQRVKAYAVACVEHVQDCAEQLIIERLDEMEEAEASAQ